MDMSKFCQSCLRPLDDKGKNQRGTEKDGSLSDEYCNLCYKDGSFIEPDITYDEMVKRGVEGINKSNFNFIKKFVHKKYYPGLLRKTKRFKNIQK